MESDVLGKWIIDELEDVAKYTHAYKDTGCGIYYDIAREELHHAKFLCEIYESKGGNIAEYTDKIKKAEEKFYSAR